MGQSPDKHYLTLTAALPNHRSKCLVKSWILIMAETKLQSPIFDSFTLASIAWVRRQYLQPNYSIGGGRDNLSLFLFTP